MNVSASIADNEALRKDILICGTVVYIAYKFFHRAEKLLKIPPGGKTLDS